MFEFLCVFLVCFLPFRSICMWGGGGGGEGGSGIAPYEIKKKKKVTFTNQKYETEAILSEWEQFCLFCTQHHLWGTATMKQIVRAHYIQYAAKLVLQWSLQCAKSVTNCSQENVWDAPRVQPWCKGTVFHTDWRRQSALENHLKSVIQNFWQKKKFHF